MKIIGLICIVLFTFFFANPEDQWSDYYKLTNQANREIYQSDYLSAETSFKEAFEKVAFPHSNDIIKLIFCRHKNGWNKTNQDLLIQLVDDKKINPKQLKFELQNLLSNSDMDYLEDLLFQKHTTAVKDTMISIIVSDQAIRSFGHCREIEDLDEQRACSRLQIVKRDSMDEVNAKRFIDLVKANGIPNENSLGTYLYENDASSTFNNLFYILGIHFMQTKVGKEVLGIYKDGLNKGLIHPDVYAAVSDFATENTRVDGKIAYDLTKSYLSTTIEIVEDKLYKPFIYYSDTLMQQINDNRLSIGLDSFHIYQKQAVCSGHCKGEGKQLQITNHARNNEIPDGFAKAAFAKEGVDLETYRLDLTAILKECDCKDKEL